MSHFLEKHRKGLFFFILAASFVTIFVYNCLTPYMSDDYAYLIEVQKAKSLWDLIRQQYGEYLSNSGRIIGQFNVRLSLWGSKQIFNVVNSAMFVALIGLMYLNIRRKKKYDLFVLLLIITFLWKYTVDFGQTILWICGACNYLWGSVIILGFVTFYRHMLDNASRRRYGVGAAVIAFVFGAAAGWCNENTSGGGLLLILLFSLLFFIQKRKEKERTVYPFMITGVLGMCTGILGMITAPGVRNRSQVMSEDEYTGIVGLLSRIYKITMNIRELFFTVLVLFTIVLVILILQKKLKSCGRECILFGCAWLATCYAIALAPTPANRAFFGAGVFLMIACIQGIRDVSEEELVIRTAKYSLVSILCLWLCFTYLDNLVNLARIYREENERIDMIYAEKADPDEDGVLVVPKLREAFANPYSNAHLSDLQEDKDYWINHFYEAYYDLGTIIALPREEWDEQYGDNSR